MSFLLHSIKSTLNVKREQNNVKKPSKVSFSLKRFSPMIIKMLLCSIDLIFLYDIIAINRF